MPVKSNEKSQETVPVYSLKQLGLVDILRGQATQDIFIYEYFCLHFVIPALLILGDVEV